jgi:hypothetical protein
VRDWEVSSLWLGALTSHIGRIWVVCNNLEDKPLDVLNSAAGIRIWTLAVKRIVRGNI